MNITQVSEPRSLDPASMTNNGSSAALLGNTLYGTLFTWDPATSEPVTEDSFAESFVSEDGGTTYVLTLREGITFSDGSPYDAAAVEAQWTRLKDPATAALDIAWASNIASMKVLSPLQLEISLAAPISTFGAVVATSSLTWIPSPAAVAQGAASFDANPIGAGPFTLSNWVRGNKFSFVRNDGYFFEGKPYLDGMEIGFTGDSPQRMNQMVAGQIDMGMESSFINLAKFETDGYQVISAIPNGGTLVAFNSDIAPFNDVRAREAVTLALNKETISEAAYQGKAQIPNSLFNEDSPYHTVDLPAQDTARAQELFNELAAEGKPVEFTFSTFPTAELRVVAESVQAQLNVFDNVKVEVEILDFVEASLIIAQRRFEAATSAIQFIDPGTALYHSLHSSSRSNTAGIKDAEMDAALEAGRAAQTEDERKAAFATVQERFNELFPAFAYIRTVSAAVANDKVGGLNVTGYGSVKPELLWLVS